MIKREPETNLTSRSKTFDKELLNPRSSCKPEQSTDEKKFLFYLLSFFLVNQVKSLVPQTNIAYEMQYVGLCWDLKFQ